MAPTAAESLEGVTLEGGWRIVSRIVTGSGATGGNFSVGYEAVRDDGLRGYVKALDFSKALRAPDQTIALQAMTQAYNFERNLLKRCRTNGMDRIVMAISDGVVEVTGFGDLSKVSYLVFECADSDIRVYLDRLQSIDVAWLFRTLHQVAIGMHQLHLRRIAHQDLKPSNVLVFDELGAKIADLGCASVRDAQCPRDGLKVAGDPQYAPPELLYGQVDTDWLVRRLGCDIYTLGSLAMFLFANANATPALLGKIDEKLHPTRWAGKYSDVLPFLLDAWERVLREVEIHVTPQVKGLSTALVTTIRELTSPDPSERGHPTTRRRLGNPYSLERYVSRFDLLARRARIGEM